MSVALLAQFLIESAFLVSFLAIFVSFIAARHRHTVSYMVSKRAALVIFILLFSASSLLVFAYLTGLYQIKAVHDYSDQFLTWPYRLVAIYAGQTGSLLFWGCLLSFFIYLQSTIKLNDNNLFKTHAYSLAVSYLVAFFFLLLLAFIDRPFILFDFVPQDGRGMNPILQNPAMLIHPPLLYIGYISFTVPFALAIGSILARQSILSWQPTLRYWVIFSWLMLGLGNIIGSWWSYVELGWGGFWGWDPVENSSFMPWLIATALLHSLLAEKKRGYLTITNLALILMTFSFTVFGTFITRSGLIESVHAYARSPIGYYFLIFLFLLLLGGITLIYLRARQTRGKAIDRLLSRGGAIIAFVWLLLFAVAFILYGVFLPQISSLLLGKKLTAVAAYYNSGMKPVGCIFLLLLGLGLLSKWRGHSLKELLSIARLPLLAALIGGLLISMLVSHDWYVILSLALVIFVLVVLIGSLLKELKKLKDKAAKERFAYLKGRTTKYGIIIIHLSVLMFFVGFSGTFFKQEKEVNLLPGKVINFSNYQISLKKVGIINKPGKAVIFGQVFVDLKNKKRILLKASRQVFHKYQQPVSEVAVYSTLVEDLYLILGEVNLQENSASFKLVINPLISWLWLGGFFLFCGSLLLFIKQEEKIDLEKL